jgi:outer membrane protein assembly factor BamB
VREEWQYYKDQHKPIIPVMRHMPESIHFQLNRLQRIDFIEQPFGVAIRQLVAALKQEDQQTGPHQPEDPASPTLRVNRPSSAKVDGAWQPDSILQGRYRISGVLGGSGMTVVYEAHDLNFPSTKRLVAIKEHLSPSNDPVTRSQLRHNFDREVSILATLNHHSIPTIMDYFWLNERAYIVLQYIGGADLEYVAANTDGPLPPDKVLGWAQAAAAALAYLHRQSPDPVVYRNLQPSNVMVDLNNHLWLTDFGLAKALEGGPKHTAIGTEGYSAPEMYRGDAYPASDVYMLGATLHHLLTGHDPRLEAPFTFTERSIRDANPAVTTDFEAAVMKALAFDPAERYPDGAAMLGALQSLGGGPALVQVARPTVREGRAVPGRKRRPDEAERPVEPLWRFQVEDEIRTAPVVYQETVFATSYDSSLYALGVNGGRLRWRHTVDAGIATTPAISPEDALVIFGADDWKLHAVEISSGRLVWAYETHAPVRSSPVVAHGHVFFGSDDGHCYALRASTGRAAWRYDAGSAVRSRPAITTDMMIFGLDSGEVLALDLAGQKRWAFKTRGMVLSGPTAAADENIVYVGSADGYLYAVDMTSGFAIWRYRTGKAVVSSPLVTDGLVIFGSVDSHVYAVDARNGRERWKFQAGNQVTSSPVRAGKTIYIGGVDGRLYGLDIQTGTVQWAFQTDGPIAGAPAVDEERVFVGSADGHLYALAL